MNYRYPIEDSLSGKFEVCHAVVTWRQVLQETHPKMDIWQIF